MSKKTVSEVDLDIFDVFKSDNGNLFIKMTNDYSLAIGPKGHHGPYIGNDFSSSYVTINSVSAVKKVGRIVFDKPKKKKKNE